jgi:hypothetical protein
MKKEQCLQALFFLFGAPAAFCLAHLAHLCLAHLAHVCLAHLPHLD